MGVRSRIIVIGAGASGLMAAITASRLGARVTVLEHMNFTARKIEHTGNGRCNITNRNQDISFYNGVDKSFIEKVLGQFTFEQTISFFGQLGLVFRENDGYFYPISNQASAVSDILRMEAAQLNIKIACNIKIKSIIKENNVFKVITEGYEYEGDSVIIAAGSKAAATTGSDGSGYELARGLGHSVIGPYPALTALYSCGKYINMLAGLRNNARATLFIDDRKIASEVGELQFIKKGISGIPVFQLSRYASIALSSCADNEINSKRCKVTLCVDFLPMYDEGELKKLISDRLKYNSYKNLKGFLKGLLHEKIINVISDKIKVSGNINMSKFSEEQLKNICSIIKCFKFDINSVGDFSVAQTCAGGIPTDELNENLESKLSPNLFFAGEIIDVDGKCGGYNLQWAWSSGYVAGSSAAVN